jgi:2-polyprenyl-3-methyl-5-hydroxy-6-metoxy-1,4-benzoquinol methylase
MVFISFAFGFFYILVHAPVPMPRYHLYVLPFLCMAAGLCLFGATTAWRRRRHLSGAVVIPREELVQVTDVNNERNVYTPRLAIARAIFWSRLTTVYGLLERRHGRREKILDFGGGSGVFLKALCGYFEQVDMIDLDPSDARGIAAKYGLDNVRIIEADITSCRIGRSYDLVIALDVLEHFRDLEPPVTFIRRHLKPGGHLIVSLPTENRIYELGRKVIRKTKPRDHFHASRDIIATLRRSGFRVRDRYLVPGVAFVRLPLFEIVRLRNGVTVFSPDKQAGG